MRAVAGAACAVAISGCLIVRTEDQQLEEPCPTTVPDVLAEATGPVLIADLPEDIAANRQLIYFVGANGILSSVSPAGSAPSELTSENPNATALAHDATNLYVATESGSIIQRPLDGSAPFTIAEGFLDITGIVIDDTNVVWAHSTGVDAWSKADGTVTHLADAEWVFALGASNGRYYFGDTVNSRVRRTGPLEDVVGAQVPGPLLLDDDHLYYVEEGAGLGEDTAAIRLIPRDGGTPIVTADKLPMVTALAADSMNLYFITQRNDLYRIQQVTKFGGTVRTLACGDDSHAHRLYLAVSRSGVVYWTDGVGLSRIVPGYTP
jgi:hypothetical protein